MEKVKKICASFLLPFFKQAEMLGYGRDLLLKETGITLRRLHDPCERIQFQDFARCVHTLVQLTAEPALGLKAGQQNHPSILGPLTNVMLNSPTLGESYQNYLEYEHLINEARKTRLKIDDDSVYSHIEYAGYDDEQIAPIVERDLSSLMQFIRFLTFTSSSKEPIIKKVQFKHRPLTDTADYLRLFQAPVSFEESANLIVVDRNLLETPIPGASKSAYFLALEEIRRFKQKTVNEHLLSEQIREFLLTQGYGKRVGAKEISAHFAMSLSALHRKLKSESTTFKILTEKVGIETALRMLKENSATLEEISEQLGFSSTSAFHKAFKRWAGHPPSFYRENSAFLSPKSLDIVGRRS